MEIAALHAAVPGIQTNQSECALCLIHEYLDGETIVASVYHNNGFEMIQSRYV